MRLNPINTNAAGTIITAANAAGLKSAKPKTTTTTIESLRKVLAKPGLLPIIKREYALRSLTIGCPVFPLAPLRRWRRQRLLVPLTHNSNLHNSPITTYPTSINSTSNLNPASLPPSSSILPTRDLFFLSSYPPQSSFFFTRSHELCSSAIFDINLANHAFLRHLKFPLNLKMDKVKDGHKKPTVLDSTHPVLVPEEKALRYTDGEFDNWVQQLLIRKHELAEEGVRTKDDKTGSEEGYTIVSDETSQITLSLKNTNPFVAALRAGEDPSTSSETPDSFDGERIVFHAPDNMTLTTNMMPAHVSTLSPTLDLFTDLSPGVSGARRNALLTQAWAHDPLTTLKIIFNSRSIHLGKGDKEKFYNSLGWLAKSGRERTVLGNLAVVVGRVIERPKKESKKKEASGVDKMDVDKKEDEVTEKESEEDREARMLSHGYWKDLLNLCVLGVSDALRVDAATYRVLNPEGKIPASREGLVLKRKSKKGEPAGRRKKQIKTETATVQPERRRKETKEEKIKRWKDNEHRAEQERHQKFLEKWNSEREPFYKLLHLTVARLFAKQLQNDSELLNSGDKSNLRKLSLAAKWAPSLEGHHDTRTFLASSIAEYLFPESHPAVHNKFNTREGYLKLAREHYRMKYLSPLRKALAIVEREICSNSFKNINYSRVPSLAMQRYTSLFTQKDHDRFFAFLEKVALGKAGISGATLSPGTMVRATRKNRHMPGNEVQAMVANLQWNTLVNSVKERGVLDNVLAVVDVSGSMEGPYFSDKTCPMDQAVGLGLLLSEASQPPWKGLVITFSQTPNFIDVYGNQGDLTTLGESQLPTFGEKVTKMLDMPWGMNTDFLAVFQKLILPRAIEAEVKPEDMVKKVFVFSDMQFDEACTPMGGLWETGYQTIKREFEENGYEVPEMVFWNLAGQVATGSTKMPVEKETPGVTMLSGFGPGMLKGFLEGGLGEVEEVVEEEVVVEEVDGEEMVKVTKVAKKKRNPEENMKVILGNRAYDGLRVLDK